MAPNYFESKKEDGKELVNQSLREAIISLVVTAACFVCFVIVGISMYFDSQPTPTPPGIAGRVTWAGPDPTVNGTTQPDVRYGDTTGAELIIFIPNDDGKFKFGQEVRIIRYE